jgi:hypothetical protein
MRAGQSVPGKERNLRDGIPTPRDWKERYLEHVREHGHYALAARVAGVSQKTAQRERHANPDFDELCREAREEAADNVELKMMASAEISHNPVPYIVRLKALRPHEYIEKHAVVSLSMTAEVPGVNVPALLAQMLGHLTPPTRELLAQHAPPQLPETTDG